MFMKKIATLIILSILIILSTAFIVGADFWESSPEYLELETEDHSIDEEYDAAAIEPEPELPTPTPSKIAYLTFDDGPSATITPQILDILKEHNIRATFFVLPRSGVDHIFERIIVEGHALGNHSFTHNFSRLYANDGGAFFRDDTIRMHAFLYDNFGYRTNIYRFPGGSMSWSRTAIDIRRNILEELGYVDFDWHVSSADTCSSPAGRDPRALAGNIVNNANGRERLIVLMHDVSNEAVVAALPMIIEGLKEQGYGFGVLRNENAHIANQKAILETAALMGWVVMINLWSV